MYVDKKLEGVRAVQTLSRMNRIHPGKTDTFVLDFANDTEQIQDAFGPFFEATIAEPTDPNLLYNAAARLDAFGVIDRMQAASFTTVSWDPEKRPTHRCTRCLTRRSSATPRCPTTTRARRSERL